MGAERFLRGAAAALVSLMVLAQAGLAVPADATQIAGRHQASCSAAWHIVPSPNSSEDDDNTLLAVSASGPDDAWAVGFLGAGVSGFIGTLALHWNGERWRVVETPSPGRFASVLFGVEAIAPDDAWAVGFIADSVDFSSRPLAMHWDGSTWTVVRAPRPAGTEADLFDVDASPSGRVWAVGFSAHDPTVDNRTLVESWNGARWTIVRSPTPRPGITRLDAVDALSAKKAWAVGLQGPFGRGVPLVERWNGERWRTVETPNAGGDPAELAAVSAGGPHDVWAVGSVQSGPETNRALALHFDGFSWRTVPTPHVRGSDSLAGVASLSARDVWAAGRRIGPAGRVRPLVEHWNGSSWEMVPVPVRPKSLGAELTALAADRAGTLWAVGSYQDPVRGLSRTLIERSCQAPSVPTCLQALATIEGTRKRDVLEGTSHRDVIVARGGNDVVRGRGGNDVICGGSGRDALLGGTGNDVIRGGHGPDRILGSRGDDDLRGGRGADLVDDSLARASGVQSDTGSDFLAGGRGNDLIPARDGTGGNDKVIGGRGVDVCKADRGDSLSACEPARTRRVSVSSREAQAGGDSEWPALSSAGRFVAFASAAPNLVPGDQNDTFDVFVRDRRRKMTEIVSVSSSGAPGNAASVLPAISGDGRFVVFQSEASTLVPGDIPPGQEASLDLFLHDRRTGATERVSVNSDGEPALAPSFQGDLTRHGRFIAFVSAAGNLDERDTNSTYDIFVRDRRLGTTELISVSPAGVQDALPSFFPSISADGRFVAFDSSQRRLVDGDTNRWNDVFVADRQTGAIERVSVDSAGRQANRGSSSPDITPNGRWVVFDSIAGNLVPGDPDDRTGQVYAHDRATGRTTLVSRGASGGRGDGQSGSPSVSDDGRYVAFASAGSNLIRRDTNGDWDSFVFDRRRGRTIRVSVSSRGVQPEGNVDPFFHTVISGNGRFIAFESAASNLVTKDSNRGPDIFVRGPLHARA